MAKMTKTAGKGRVATPAPKSAKGESTTTAKKAGVPTRPTPQRHADIIAQVRQLAMKAGYKPPYENTVLDMALAKADAMKVTMTSAGLYVSGDVPKGKADAQARREWCAKVRAPKVAIADILHDNKKGKSKSARSEAVVRIRIQKRGAYLYGDPFHYYAVRCEPVTGKVDDQPMVYIVRL